MQIAKTHEDILQILSQIQYNKPTWFYRIIPKGDGYLLQYTFQEKDLTSDSETLETQFCRKWYISPYMTDSEIVTTAYKAVCAAEMHEVAERFTYMGARIFDPHLDYNNLAQHILTGEIGLDARQ